MKQLLLVTLLFTLGCSDDRKVEATVNANNGTSCSVAPEYSQNLFGDYQETSVTQIGARLSCTDGSFAIVLNGERGLRGNTGLTGAIGQAGTSCSVSRQYHDDRVKVQCGNQVVYVYDGDDGRNGTSCSVTQLSNGALITCGNSVALIYNGANGSNGTSCSISNLSNGARITCGNSSQDLYDGDDGQDSPLLNAIGITSYIKPCGTEFDNDEILLRMTDGNILALYDGGPHEDRLALLAPGNYITTDRNRNHTCHFTVTNSLQITNQYVD